MPSSALDDDTAKDKGPLQKHLILIHTGRENQIILPIHMALEQSLERANVKLEWDGSGGYQTLLLSCGVAGTWHTFSMSKDSHPPPTAA